MLVFSIVGFVIALVLSGVLLRNIMLLRIRRKLINGIKVPMTLCDKGHLYPADSSLRIDVPEMPAPVELCPFCYDINMKNAAKEVSNGSTKKV